MGGPEFPVHRCAGETASWGDLLRDCYRLVKQHNRRQTCARLQSAFDRGITVKKCYSFSEDGACTLQHQILHYV